MGDRVASGTEYIVSNEGFHTVDCLRSLPSTLLHVAFSVLSIEDSETYGWQQNHALSPWRLDEKHSTHHNLLN